MYSMYDIKSHAIIVIAIVIDVIIVIAIVIDVQYLSYQKPCNHSDCNCYRCTVCMISKAMQS